MDKEHDPSNMGSVRSLAAFGLKENEGMDKCLHESTCCGECLAKLLLRIGGWNTRNILSELCLRLFLLTAFLGVCNQL
jgi:hypothetical protein